MKGCIDFNDPHRVNQGGLACDSVSSLRARHKEALDSIRRRGESWRTTRREGDPAAAAAAAGAKDGDGGAAALAVRTFVIDVHGWPAAGLCDGSSSGISSSSSGGGGSGSGGGGGSSSKGIGALGEDVLRSTQPFVVLPRYLTRHYGPLINETRNQLLSKHREVYEGRVDPTYSARRGVARDMSACKNVSDGTVPGGGDMRCSHCSKWSPLCKVMTRDADLIAIGQAYYNRVYARRKAKGKPPPVKAAMVMANAFSGRGANSGGNWHQDVKCKFSDFDSAEVCEEQMKCMVYLEDTYGHNGPFTMLVDYDRDALAARSKLSAQIPNNPGDDDRPHRFATRDIADATRLPPMSPLSSSSSSSSSSSDSPARTDARAAFAVELHAPAGTVICFDSGSVHHGKNLQRGHRAALTMYLTSPRRTAFSGRQRDWAEEVKRHLGRPPSFAVRPTYNI